MVLAWAIHALDLTWDVPRIALLLATLFSCSCFFYGLFVLQGVLSFWTTETLELVNGITYGGVQTAQYPLSIYQPWLRRFFTVILPMGCVTYFPLLAILRRPDPLGTPVLFHWLSPLAGVAFVLVTLRLWQVGVRQYCSTGS